MLVFWGVFLAGLGLVLPLSRPPASHKGSGDTPKAAVHAGEEIFQTCGRVERTTSLDHPAWRIIPVSKWLGSPPFMSHEKAIWKGNNPT